MSSPRQLRTSRQHSIDGRKRGEGIMYGDVNVTVEDGNLGRSSSTGSGVQFKIGISNIESATPILITGSMDAKKIKGRLATPRSRMPASTPWRMEQLRSTASRSRQPQTEPSGKSRQSRQERNPRSERKAQQCIRHCDQGHR